MGTSCAVRLLGGFAVAVDGEPVSANAWRTRRAADLVKLLALEPTHWLHREQVIEALWPDLPVRTGAANLRKAVHHARRAMGSADSIQLRDGMLVLWPDGHLNIDLDRFDAAAADALASGDPEACADIAATFPGTVLPADRYEPWVADARARTAATYLVLLKAAGAWERVLELDPTDEAAYRALMARHLAAGERREAIRQFERLRDVLREHIGVGPDPQTVRLYEQVLAMEGDEPPTPAERTAALLANGLVAWGRRDLDQAERLARQVRGLALDAGLGHELGEAATLLALIAYARGNWHDVFRAEFAESVHRDRTLKIAIFDAHLCFQEFYLYGSDGHDGADAFARELLEIATRAASTVGKALATLLLGEFALLSGDVDEAIRTLRRSLSYAERAGSVSARCIAMERLAEAYATDGERETAAALLAAAHPIAESSEIRSHLIIRLYGVQVLAVQSVIDVLRVIQEAERWLIDAPRVCDPCSMTFRIEAARACARAGELARARRHLAEAERITGLWQGGPWTAAVWEARAELRRAEGHREQASALLMEAADGFAELHRPLDESRCRAAAASLVTAPTRVPPSRW
jgi:DNA-binding SARP family transcriptional activator